MVVWRGLTRLTDIKLGAARSAGVQTWVIESFIGGLRRRLRTHLVTLRAAKIGSPAIVEVVGSMRGCLLCGAPRRYDCTDFDRGGGAGAATSEQELCVADQDQPTMAQGVRDKRAGKRRIGNVRTARLKGDLSQMNNLKTCCWCAGGCAIDARLCEPRLRRHARRRRCAGVATAATAAHRAALSVDGPDAVQQHELGRV